MLTDLVFREEAKKKLALTCFDEEFDKAWNDMLGDIPINRLELLLNLKKNFKTFLLSNTNAIHHKFFTKTVQQNTRGQVLDDFFNKTYYSYQLNMRKPDVEIFNHVLEQNSLEASETIFLDDSLANLEGASKAGIQVCHISNPKMIFTFFQ
jgi:putative hydrolase of the HAD superfamily